MLGSIFADPVAGAPLVVMGGGFQADTVSGKQQPPVAVGPGTATYAGGTAGWILDLPGVGRGSLFQVSATLNSPGDWFSGVYSGRLSASGSPASLSQGSLDIFAPAAAGSAIRDVAWFNYWAFSTPGSATQSGVNGVTGLARPAPAAAIPASGQRSFTSLLVGVLSNNFANMVTTQGTLQADFGAGRLTGALDVVLACMMGCSYPLQRYALDGTSFDRTAGRFTGTLSGPGGQTGTYTAQLAGPDANELLLSAEFDYREPDGGTLVRSQAILIGRVP